MLFTNTLYFSQLCFSDTLHKNLMDILHLSFSKISIHSSYFQQRLFTYFTLRKILLRRRKHTLCIFVSQWCFFGHPLIILSKGNKHWIELKIFRKYIDFLMYSIFSRTIAFYQHPEVKKTFWDTLLILKVWRLRQNYKLSYSHSLREKHALYMNLTLTINVSKVLFERRKHTFCIFVKK